MANPNRIIPFILKWEGGLSKDTADAAAIRPVPDGSGNHTNKGVTWAVWANKYGTSSDSINRWYKMTISDWRSIFQPLYFNTIGGDKINSQKIADILANWAWASGPKTPIKAVQKILNIATDGIAGPITITAINKANEKELLQKLQQANYQFFHDLGEQPGYSKFYAGWLNRLNDLYQNYLQPKILPAAIIATILVAAILSK